MRPSLRKLIDVLEQEISIVAELVEILQEDQQRIARRDIDGLESSTVRKEERVLRFQSLEQARISNTNMLGAELGLPEDQMRVSALCPLLGPEAVPLRDTADRLRAIVASLGELAAISRGFLEQSILGMRGLLSLVNTLRSGEPATYDAQGRCATTTRAASVAIRREV